MAKTQIMPEPDENGYVRTLNNMGYMTSTLDPISRKFIEYSSPNKVVLEIGAAYGIATIEALKRGARVIANDLDGRHLEILQNRCPSYLKKNLVLKPGRFPEELDIPANTIDAILICRVLHFFSGPEIEHAVNTMQSWLVDGGKIFIIAETPYLRNWQAFIPEYEARKQSGEKWPGFIADTAKYIPNNPYSLFPKQVNWLDPDVLARTFDLVGLETLEVSTIDRYDIPPTIRFDGRESVGIIGKKTKMKYAINT